MGQKLTLTFLFAFLCLGLQAQHQTTLDQALRYLETNSKNLKLSADDLKESQLSYQYTDRSTGITHIYLNQSIDGVRIKNAILNITLKNNEVFNVSSSYIPEAKKLVANQGRSTIDLERAVMMAATHLGVQNAEQPEVISRDGNSFKLAPTSYVNSEINVEKVYSYVNNELVLTWQATLDMKQSADYWEIRMNAGNGEFVDKNNLTVYCSHHKGQYTNHNHDCNAHRVAQKETSSISLEEAIAQGVPSYKVYALPAESPNHGSHELVVNPHYTTASPYGWHDTDGVDGAEFTITRGNNVFAYTDVDDDDSPDANIAQPDGGDELVFDFNHNLSVEPMDSPDAAQVNLFYMNNMMHDLMYLVGFNEESGNFQQNNYGNGGLGSDFVLAQAFDGFELQTPSLNNANFSTPGDGSSGRMQMFLWQAPSGDLFVDEPADLSRFYEHSNTDGNWGAAIPGENDPPVTGKIEVVNDGSLTNPTTGCQEIENDLTGKVALIDRGLCDFSLKAYNAQTKGAIAVMICNIEGVNGGDGEEFINMSGGENANLVNIPVVFCRKSDCDAIKISISNDVDVQITFQVKENDGPEYLDGAFDNGVIAHEFGHGISNRLTGGPNNSGCLSNDEQMGEGWSDFFSLITTVEPGDKGEDARGIGTFANGEGTDGRGIRRYPYSTDMDINPQTYDDIKGTTAPHPLGEVWAGCLWDMYWKMVDQYGYSDDWENLESGNARAIRLVMEGMKQQSCLPGFIQGRDGILKADTLLYGGENACLIWEVFARRGVGFFADGGSTDDRNDGVENFETFPPCIAELKITKTMTEIVKGGEDIQVTLKAVNHVAQTMNNVVITDEIPEGTSYDAGSASMTGSLNGDIVSFELGNMEFGQEVTITYNLKTDATKNSVRLEFYDFEEDSDEWTLNVDEGFTTWSTSFDLYKSAETSYHIGEEEADNDHSLVSPEWTISGTRPVLKFWHKYETESGTDGGFVQISTDGGKTWGFTKEDDFLRGGYNSIINYSTLAIPALEGFTGSSQEAFIDSYLDLEDYIGQDIQIRFRYGSNEEVITGDAFGGWYVDDVELMDLFSYKGKACIMDENGENGACTLPVETILDSDGESSNEELGVNNFGVEVSPNPADDYFQVALQSKTKEDVQLTLVSMDGSEVFRSTVTIGTERTAHTIYTNDLPSGFYVLNIQNANAQYSEKVVIK